MLKIQSSPQDAQIQDRMGDMPLHEVCHTGAPYQVIQRLIHAHKPALKTKGFCGRLPLHYASYNKPSVNVIKLLLQHYPDAAFITDDDGRLPLHLAVVRNASGQSIQALIAANPKGLSTANKFGCTPVMLARNEHVYCLLTEEGHKPRGISTKIDLMKKMKAVWNDPRQNPVMKAQRQSLSLEDSTISKSRRHHQESEKNDKPLKVANERAKANAKTIPSKSLFLSMPPQLKSTAHSFKPTSPDSVFEIMSSERKDFKITMPERDGMGKKIVMANHRMTVLPCPATVTAHVQANRLFSTRF